jgi:hypothetical protein
MLQSKYGELGDGLRALVKLAIGAGLSRELVLDCLRSVTAEVANGDDRPTVGLKVVPMARRRQDEERLSIDPLLDAPPEPLPARVLACRSSRPTGSSRR